MAEDKKLLVSPVEFRRRLMSIKKDNTQDYSKIDSLGVAIMDINGNFYKDADEWRMAESPVVNGIAVSDGIHRFCIAKDMINSVCVSGEYPDYDYWGSYGTLVEGVTTHSSSSGIIEDFNGKLNTDAIVSQVTYSDGYFTKAPWSAAGLCREFIFPNGSKGYLGAYGEFYIARTLKTEINALMEAIGGSKFETKFLKYTYWTSTQEDAEWVWTAPFNDSLYEAETKKYSSTCHIRAFCTLDKPQINVITFYIEGVTLTATEGMTWREYINSGFSKYPFAFSEGTYVVVTHTLYDYTNYLTNSDYSIYIGLDDVIENGGTYVIY